MRRKGKGKADERKWEKQNSQEGFGEGEVEEGDKGESNIEMNAAEPNAEGYHYVHRPPFGRRPTAFLENCDGRSWDFIPPHSSPPLQKRKSYRILQ